MIVLGLTGYARAGKDTVADYLVANHGFTKLSFASPIKEMLRKLDPILGDDACAGIERLSDYGGKDENEIKAGINGDEYRRLLQTLGTDCVRAVDEDFWVNAAKKMLTDTAGRYVFSDVRMPNEAQMIYGIEGLTFETEAAQRDLWEIERDGTGPGVGCHVTEMYVGELGESITIINNGSLEDLAEPIETALRYSFPEVFRGTS